MGAQRGVILDGHTVRSYRHSKLSEEVASCLCMVRNSNKELQCIYWFETLQVLLKHGASVEAESKFDKSPADVADDNGRPDLKEIIEVGRLYGLMVFNEPPLTFSIMQILDNSVLIHLEMKKNWIMGK